MPIITGSESKKPPKHTQHESADGVAVNPGPFIGIVKNNIDPMRSGRLQVWIPELGGDANDQSAWKTVAYATPFYGVTPWDIRGTRQDFAGGSPHSYGMWFVPPDVEIKVLCIFVNGDPYRGYWFGCIPEFPNLHMVPGLSSAKWHGGRPEPVVDWNDANDANSSEFFKKASTPHEYQVNVWKRQGLISDPYRGPGVSSAFRETPSRVFGISTPGPEIAVPSGTESDNPEIADLRIRARQGGHTFVMDDGDTQGNSQLIRLRTSNGNMLLLNDSAGIVYLINSSGSAWFELDGSGNIKAFSQGEFSLHATSAICLETPGKFSITGGTVDISSKGAVKISGSTVDVAGKSGVKVGGGGELHLSGSKSYLSGKQCVGITGKAHIDMKAGCITLNTKKVTEAKEPGQASPCQGPTHEPFGHQNSSSTSPASSTSYGARNGVQQGASGTYGAAGSFGSTASVPNYYGAITNQNGPIKFTKGFQGSLDGQAANLGDLDSFSEFDEEAISYIDVDLELPPLGVGFAVNLNNPALAETTKLQPGEKLNNPGNLADLASDPFSIGQIRGLNAYASPEEGIAALSLMLDLVQAEGAMTVSEFIAGFINRKGSVV